MRSLVTCDIYRDGGSISATVLDGSQKLSFWLQTNSWDHPRQKGHEHLFISRGDDPELKAARIDIASAEEQRWLDYLLRVDDTGATSESKERFWEMVEVLQDRQRRSE